MFNIQDAIHQAATQGPNMNEATKGGEKRELPVAGLTRLRFVGYIELGIHEEEFKGDKKKREKVSLIFELSGPKHPATDYDGKKVPHTITINESLSLNEKSNFYKLFKRMNYTGEATHIAQLLGKEFLGTIFHNTKGEGTDAKTYANLRDDSGYSIRPPFVDDPDTGESRRINVDEPLTPIKCFLWSFCSKPMWDDIFIDGKWDDKKDDKGNVIKEGTSKNYWQNRIKSAINFQGSPMAEILFAGGEPDLPGGETTERSEANQQASADAKAGAAEDPLAGV